MLRDLFSLFPAYAGVILVSAVKWTLQESFPRIRGGDPFYTSTDKSGTAFSPHTRG